MVNALLLMTIVIFVSVQSVMKKAYNEKVTGGAMSFSAASCVAALVVFHPEWVETFDADRYLKEPFDEEP